MISYPVRLIPEGKKSIMLTFPDISEACVVGASEDAVFHEALPELEKALASYVAGNRPIPCPSDICGAPTVTTYRFRLKEMDAEH